MVESVDTKDLKSFGLNSRAGSSPASSTETSIPCKINAYKGLMYLYHINIYEKIGILNIKCKVSIDDKVNVD